MANDLNHNMAHGAEELFMTFRIQQIAARLKITDSRPSVIMTGQIFFSPDKTPILAGQIFFSPDKTPILAGQINEYYNFFFAYGISNYAGNRSLYCIDVQVFCSKLVKNSFTSC